MNDDFVDGNALAGPLAEVFAVDVTGAVGQCARCGQIGAVGTLRVYMRDPGLVARCPSCDATVLRLVRGPDRIWLDLHGSASLELPLGSSDESFA